MAGSLGSLAQGFIQGSQLGMQIKQQERQAEESDSLMNLRQSAEKRAQEKDKRDEQSHKQNLSLRELEAERLGSQEQRAVSQEKRLGRQEDRAGRQEDRLNTNLNWQIAKDKRVEEDRNLASIAPIEYNRVAGGGDFSPEFMEQAKGTRFDPVYMAKPEYSKAAKTAYDHVGDLVQKANKDGPNSIGLADVNKPEFIQSLGVLMAPDIKRGVGEKDPISGKTIVDKEISTIIPYEDQGLVVDVKVTLDDGTSYLAPITEGRSRDPEDPVKIIPVAKFMDNIEGYVRMASAYNQSDLQNAVMRYSGTPAKPNSSAEVTKRQYLSELGRIDRDEAKELAKINADSFMDPVQKAETVANISGQYKDLRSGVSKRYGVMQPKETGNGSSSVIAPRGGGQKTINVETWASDDPKKKAFIKSGEEYASESGESPFDAFSPSELDKIYMDWSNEQEANDLADMLSK